MKKQIFILLLLLSFCALKAQVKGCTDPLSRNYNPMATVNDGSCEYKQVSIAAESSVKLPNEVVETSGLIKYDNSLYTLNDDADVNLYAIDSISGAILKTLPLTRTVNHDWEELAQDEDYFYIGDFGNNVKGNRTNLAILKVNKSSLVSGNPDVGYINFSYGNQYNFNTLASNSTTFDCEAMVISRDSIYLFTKQWSAKKTSVYALPKIPGSYKAEYKTTYDVGGLITGATYLEDKNLIVLCGYNGLVQPFLYLLYDFKEHDFFSGNKRKVTLSGMSFHQIEGITTSNGIDYFVTNEKLVQHPFVNTTQQLHRFSLLDFLGTYLENVPYMVVQNDLKDKIRIYSDQMRRQLHINGNQSIVGANYFFLDNEGKKALEGILNTTSQTIDMRKLKPGIYTVKFDRFPDYIYKLVQK